MNRKQFIIATLVIIVCAALAVVLIKFGRRAQPEPLETIDQVVEVLRVELIPKQFKISSQGTVRAATSIPIMSELDGVVTEVSPVFQLGGFFNKGDVLLRLDPTDYETLVAQAESQLAAVRLKLDTIQAESKLARQDWETLSSQFDEAATPLLLREPQLKESQAAVRAAEAGLNKARKDLERTQIRAPFDGRILQKTADQGQFVRRGQELARVFDISKVEIQLPVAVSQLAFLDPRFGMPGGGTTQDPVHVKLSGQYAGGEHTWEGWISRTAGGLDERSRMISLVAEVNDPYGLLDGEPVAAPLQVGAFVEAEIHGIERSGTFTLPRSAIIEGSQVMLVDQENKIQFRDVVVLQYDGGEAVIGSGLRDGDVVCLSTLEIPVEGTQVEPLYLNSEAK